MSLSLFHLHGELKDLPFPRLLAGLRADRFTGVLQANCRDGAPSPPPSASSSAAPRPRAAAGAVPEAGTTREVHFADGHIAWAISTDPDESLKAYLLRHAAVTERQWVAAEAQAAGTTLRQALIDTGAIAARELSQMEKGRIEEIVLALFPVRDGDYRVRERQIPPGTPDLNVAVDPLLLRGMMASADYALVMEEIGSLDAVPVLAGGSRAEADAALPGEFQGILKRIDGKTSVAALCAATGLPDNYVCTVVAALNLVGAVKRQPAGRPRHDERAPAARGATGSPPTVPARAVAPPPSLPLLDPAPAPETAADTERTEPAAAPAPIAAAPQPRPVVLPPIAPLRAAEAAPLPPIRPIARPAPLALQEELPEDEMPDDELPAEDLSAEDFEAETQEESLEEAPEGAAPAPAVYGAVGGEDRSRPWFLLGGAAAVAFAALFLILMSQGGGSAEEYLKPAPAAPVSTETEIAEEPDIPAAPTARQPIASAPAAPILSDGPRSDPGGRRRLEAGDIAGAARSFSRESARGAGDYTIQLLAACREETVERAVRSARGSAELFVLPAKVEGRDCYRVLWGRYATPRIAEEALRTDVPSIFREDRNRPRVTRLPG